eukprot:CAMPEP_0170478952 /NCGR_PEP_ID=MMETSP0208-20121228/359_1 /TAXON_ID=197538 /ORGANISM="Strombidium inclinatum, Strain S3" /LENGTH=79 /DNA_ID=CAMNT_0010751285 /DNA_START=143 /DNA_END=381 /DNA_ORIENTATION=-
MSRSKPLKEELTSTKGAAPNQRIEEVADTLTAHIVQDMKAEQNWLEKQLEKPTRADVVYGEAQLKKVCPEFLEMMKAGP